MLSVGAAAAWGPAAADYDDARGDALLLRRVDGVEGGRTETRSHCEPSAPPAKRRRNAQTRVDGQTGCGTPPCRRSDSAVASSASARRARVCPSVEAGQWFVSPGSREPVSSNAEPHHTEPSFAQRLLTPQTEPSRRSRLPKFGAPQNCCETGFVGRQASAQNHSPRPPGAPRAAQHASGPHH